MKVIKKILRHSLGLSGVIIIGIISFLALAGNIITPDKTENANLQCLPIMTSPPLSKYKFFIVPNKEETGFFKTWFQGGNDPEIYLPIEKMEIKGESILLSVYRKESSPEIEVLDLNRYKGRYKLKEITFILGTDGMGRDVFSRIVAGSRVSLLVGFITVLIALFIGSVLGLLAGYFRSWVDLIITWIINVTWSLPTILLVVAISFAVGKGFWQIFIAIGLSTWVEVARVVRGEVFSLREKEFIQAAKVLGFSSVVIMFRHLLPNLKSSLTVLAVSVFGTAILLESGLSFLGLGLAPPAPSWGMMIRENYQYITFDHAFLAIVPGVFIMALVLAFNFIGIALRDALDIHLK